jgi:hypothetical protein
VSGSDGEWVSVDLLDEAPATETAGPTRRSPGRLALVAGVVAALLGALLLWPDGGATTDAPTAADVEAASEQPVPDDARLIPWPGRGPWAGDDAFVDEAFAVWTAMGASVDRDNAPGPEVHALWAGPVGGVAVALLQSVGSDGVARVAQVSESQIPGSINPGSLTLSSVEAITGEPPFVALSYPGGLELGGVLDEPGSVLLQVLPAPGLVTDGVEMQRQDGPRFTTVGIQPDGLSQPWVYTPWPAPGGPVLAAVRTKGANPGLLATGLITLQSPLPGPAPVQIVPAGWGETRPSVPEDYLDGLAALESLDRAAGRVSILGSIPTDRGRASLVEVRPRGPGWPVVVTVASTKTGVLTSRARPAVTPDELAVGAVRSTDGALLVVASAPPETSLIVLGADGDAVTTGPRTTAMWLAREREVTEVAAQGYRDDETWVGRSSLDVSDL